MRRRLGPRQAALIVRRGFGRLALKHPLRQFSSLRCTLLKSWILAVDFVHSIASQAEGIEHQTMDGMLKLWIPRYKGSDIQEIQNYEIQIYQIQELEQILRERGPDM